MEGSWSRLPAEISELVLSFLPVPALCRCRSVCKTWNELSRKRSFLDVCDVNCKNKPHLFVTRHAVDYEGWCWVDAGYRRTICFLDLEERRWYSIRIQASLLAPTDRNIPRLLAMDDGLVCELSAFDDGGEDYNVVLLDPVAKSRWELPVSIYEDGPVSGLESDGLPALVTVVDTATRSFRVFLVNSPTNDLLSTRLFVYESSTGAWRSLLNVPERLGLNYPVPKFAERQHEESAVFFQGNLYTIFWHRDINTVLLLNYSVGENMWREVLAIPHCMPGYPQLGVTGNRLFMAMWMDYTCHLRVLNEDGSNSAHPDEEKPTFEIKEVLVNANSSRLLVQISGDDLWQIFGEKTTLSALQVALAYGFPLKSHSVVLISDQTGKAVTYDMRSRSFTVLPAHPLKQGQMEEHDSDADEEEIPGPLYRAKLMNLSLRNILSGGPVPSGSHA